MVEQAGSVAARVHPLSVLKGVLFGIGGDAGAHDATYGQLVLCDWQGTCFRTRIADAGTASGEIAA
jgi:hypothetical protein